MVRALRLPVLLGLVFMSIPSAGSTAPVPASTPAQGRITLVRPGTVVKVADMDFATLAVTTGGTATIDPIAGTMSVSGGLLHVGGTPSPARFAGASTKRTVVNIKVPKQPVLIRRIGGTETLSVSNFTLDGQDKRALADAAVFQFAVGARITVPANTVEGLYSGDIEITVHYP